MQFVTVLLYLLLAITSLFLICLVLIQRGKGGGLAGAFGGAGGSSAFGTKAGDVFTRVTMISATVWIALNMLLVVISNNRTSAWGTTPRAGAAKTSEFTPSEKLDLDKLGKPGTGTGTGTGTSKGTDLGDLAPPPPLSSPAAPATGPAPVTAPPATGSTPAPALPPPQDAPAPTAKP